MLQILITGFEPFGNSSENSSWAVAEKVTACSIEGVDVALAQMPVSFERVATKYQSGADLWWVCSTLFLVGDSLHY